MIDEVGWCSSSQAGAVLVGVGYKAGRTPATLGNWAVQRGSCRMWTRVDFYRQTFTPVPVGLFLINCDLMIKPLNALRELVNLRFRMTLALRKAAPAGRATPAELTAVVAHQTARWQDRPLLSGVAARQALMEANNRSIHAFVFSIRGTRVRIWDKPNLSRASELDRPLYERYLPFLRRARFYQNFIAKALRYTGSGLSLDLVIDVNDFPQTCNLLPIFCFQRRRGDPHPLLPDVDFFHTGWYHRENDTLAYESKANSAVFVGSSTGGTLNAEAVLSNATERLRAANHFNGNPDVLFKIAQAVQCNNEQTRTLLMHKPYFSPHIEWRQQLLHLFLISMDGNGAACSRLVKGLLSHSVVIKYGSPYELYYFSALEAGRHYLLAEQDSDVERFIATERARPGTYKPVAIAGREFAHRYLTIHSVMDYTVRLLRAFAK